MTATSEVLSPAIEMKRESRSVKLLLAVELRTYNPKQWLGQRPHVFAKYLFSWAWLVTC